MPWLSALRLYLSFTVVANLVWEVAQLPLYTLWRTGSVREIAIRLPTALLAIWSSPPQPC